MNTTIKLLAVVASLAFCGVLHAGYYATIVVTGDPSQWDSIPVTDIQHDTFGTPTTLNITSVKFANDDDWFYILVNFQTAVNPQAISGGGLFLALDNDSDWETGFDIFGLNTIGAEAGWQNDFPFAQTNGVFNSGNLVGGAAGISPYFTETTYQQMRISRAATFESGGLTIFPNDSFNFGFYTAAGEGFVNEFAWGNYEFALPVPEPGTLSLILPFALAGALIARRYRMRRQG